MHYKEKLGGDSPTINRAVFVTWTIYIYKGYFNFIKCSLFDAKFSILSLEAISLKRY